MEDILSSVEEEIVPVDTENSNDGNFNITLISAQNLPNVRNVFQNHVLAKVRVRGLEKTDKKTEWKAESDKKNGLNPIWNYRASYTVSETSIMNQDLWIVITLYSKRKFGDRIIGEVNISVRALFDNWRKGGSATLTYPVKQGNIDTGGAINISYSFSVNKRNGWIKCLKFGTIILVKVAELLLV